MSKVDDMKDTPADWPQLARPLEECETTLVPVYGAADDSAVTHQKWHRWMTRVAAVAGTVAVVVAILELPIGEQLPFREQLRRLPLVEVVAALAALVAVGLGWLASSLDTWLVERHKAERCRLQKFAFLIDPSLWCGDPKRADERVRQLREAAAATGQIRTLEEPRKWLNLVHRPQFLMELGGYAFAPAALAELVRYYRERRLAGQIEYFETRIRRYRLRDYVTRKLPQWFFFGSVLAACGHFVFELLERHGHAELGQWALSLTILAALLPAVGSGVRTYRMANEFGRNVKRFESALHVLKDIDGWLAKDTDPKTVFLTLWTCEHFLEVERREWLRLMEETEWF